MPLIHSYALWNNKGGVGKSTITYHLATRYAELNPKKKVLVIDLCPQANSSMMLLGGGDNGEQKVLSNCTLETPKTVVGYVSNVIANGRGATLPDPYNFLVKVSSENKELPENIFLLCGDGNLEPMAPAIDNAASAPPLTINDKPWQWVQNIFRTFIENLVKDDNEWMVFVDTNPSFAIYTQIAISGVKRLLAPINADDSSRTAAKALCILLHGTTPPHPIYGAWTYASKAIANDISIPKIHLVIGNRLTQFEGAAAAYEAITDATADTLYEIFQNNSNYFTTSATPVSDLSSFRNSFSRPLRDFNTAGVVCAHLGKMLSSMKQGYYKVYGNDVKVNTDKITECVRAIDEVINTIS